MDYYILCKPDNVEFCSHLPLLPDGAPLRAYMMMLKFLDEFRRHDLEKYPIEPKIHRFVGMYLRASSLSRGGSIEEDDRLEAIEYLAKEAWRVRKNFLHNRSARRLPREIPFSLLSESEHVLEALEPQHRCVSLRFARNMLKVRRGAALGAIAGWVERFETRLGKGGHAREIMESQFKELELFDDDSSSSPTGRGGGGRRGYILTEDISSTGGPLSMTEARTVQRSLLERFFRQNLSLRSVEELQDMARLSFLFGRCHDFVFRVFRTLDAGPVELFGIVPTPIADQEGLSVPLHLLDDLEDNPSSRSSAPARGVAPSTCWQSFFYQLAPNHPMQREYEARVERELRADHPAPQPTGVHCSLLRDVIQPTVWSRRKDLKERVRSSIIDCMRVLYHHLHPSGKGGFWRLKRLLQGKWCRHLAYDLCEPYFETGYEIVSRPEPGFAAWLQDFAGPSKRVVPCRVPGTRKALFRHAARAARARLLAGGRAGTREVRKLQVSHITLQRARTHLLQAWVRQPVSWKCRVGHPRYRTYGSFGESTETETERERPPDTSASAGDEVSAGDHEVSAEDEVSAEQDRGFAGSAVGEDEFPERSSSSSSQEVLNIREEPPKFYPHPLQEQGAAVPPRQGSFSPPEGVDVPAPIDLLAEEWSDMSEVGGVDLKKDLHDLEESLEASTTFGRLSEATEGSASASSSSGASSPPLDVEGASTSEGPSGASATEEDASRLNAADLRAVFDEPAELPRAEDEESSVVSVQESSSSEASSADRTESEDVSTSSEEDDPSTSEGDDIEVRRHLCANDFDPWLSRVLQAVAPAQQGVVLQVNPSLHDESAVSLRNVEPDQVEQMPSDALDTIVDAAECDLRQKLQTIRQKQIVDVPQSRGRVNPKPQCGCRQRLVSDVRKAFRSTRLGEADRGGNKYTTEQHVVETNKTDRAALLCADAGETEDPFAAPPSVLLPDREDFFDEDKISLCSGAALRRQRPKLVDSVYHDRSSSAPNQRPEVRLESTTFSGLDFSCLSLAGRSLVENFRLVVGNTAVGESKRAWFYARAFQFRGFQLMLEQIATDQFSEIEYEILMRRFRRGLSKKKEDFEMLRVFRMLYPNPKIPIQTRYVAPAHLWTRLWAENDRQLCVLMGRPGEDVRAATVKTEEEDRAALCALQMEVAEQLRSKNLGAVEAGLVVGTVDKEGVAFHDWFENLPDIEEGLNGGSLVSTSDSSSDEFDSELEASDNDDFEISESEFEADEEYETEEDGFVFRILVSGERVRILDGAVSEDEDAAEDADEDHGGAEEDEWGFAGDEYAVDADEWGADGEDYAAEDDESGAPDDEAYAAEEDESEADADEYAAGEDEWGVDAAEYAAGADEWGADAAENVVGEDEWGPDGDECAADEDEYMADADEQGYAEEAGYAVEEDGWGGRGGEDGTGGDEYHAAEEEDDWGATREDGEDAAEEEDDASSPACEDGGVAEEAEDSAAEREDDAPAEDDHEFTAEEEYEAEEDGFVFRVLVQGARFRVLDAVGEVVLDEDATDEYAEAEDAVEEDEDAVEEDDDAVEEDEEDHAVEEDEEDPVEEDEDAVEEEEHAAEGEEFAAEEEGGAAQEQVQSVAEEDEDAAEDQDRPADQDEAAAEEVEQSAAEEQEFAAEEQEFAAEEDEDAAEEGDFEAEEEYEAEADGFVFRILVQGPRFRILNAAGILVYDYEYGLEGEEYEYEIEEDELVAGEEDSAGEDAAGEYAGEEDEVEEDELAAGEEDSAGEGAEADLADEDEDAAGEDAGEEEGEDAAGDDEYKGDSADENEEPAGEDVDHSADENDEAAGEDVDSADENEDVEDATGEEEEYAVDDEVEDEYAVDGEGEDAVDDEDAYSKGGANTIIWRRISTKKLVADDEDAYNPVGGVVTVDAVDGEEEYAVDDEEERAALEDEYAREDAVDVEEDLDYEEVGEDEIEETYDDEDDAVSCQAAELLAQIRSGEMEIWSTDIMTKALENLKERLPQKSYDRLMERMQAMPSPIISSEDVDEDHSDAAEVDFLRRQRLLNEFCDLEEGAVVSSRKGVRKMISRQQKLLENLKTFSPGTSNSSIIVRIHRLRQILAAFDPATGRYDSDRDASPKSRVAHSAHRIMQVERMIEVHPNTSRMLRRHRKAYTLAYLGPLISGKRVVRVVRNVPEEEHSASIPRKPNNRVVSGFVEEPSKTETFDVVVSSSPDHQASTEGPAMIQRSSLPSSSGSPSLPSESATAATEEQSTTTIAPPLLPFRTVLDDTPPEYAECRHIAYYQDWAIAEKRIESDEESLEDENLGEIEPIISDQQEDVFGEREEEGISSQDELTRLDRFKEKMQSVKLKRALLHEDGILDEFEEEDFQVLWAPVRVSSQSSPPASPFPRRGSAMLSCTRTHSRVTLLASQSHMISSSQMNVALARHYSTIMRTSCEARAPPHSSIKTVPGHPGHGEVRKDGERRGARSPDCDGGGEEGRRKTRQRTAGILWTGGVVRGWPVGIVCPLPCSSRRSQHR